MKIKTTLFLIFLITLFLMPGSASADGIIIPDPPICDPVPCSPIPMPISISQLEIKYHHVTVTIEDQIAVSRVDQVFYNPNAWTVEGTYMFPIPKGAAVTNFILWIDGEPVEGEVLSAEEARRTYEEIVREMQDPALLEYADRGAVQAQIFPIEPGSERRIQLEYTEVLPTENGLIRYIYPLNTEKFSAQPLNEVRISVDVKSSDPIRAAYSPSHPVAISKDGDYHFNAGYEENNVRPDTDFALFYSVGEQEAFHLLSYRDPNDSADPDGFFLLLLAPRPEAAAETFPKDVILVLDRSGSMDGEKFSQAQDALRYVLQNLNADDNFNIISFSTDIETYANNMRPADEANEALSWVDRLSAVGSTDINRALLEASALANSERPTYIIFLTDGLPTEGVVENDQILNNFAVESTSNLRLFAFGVGYDVDTYLLDSLAQENHGASTYVLPGEPLGEIVSGFYARISTPVLTDIELDFGHMTTFDLYPSPLPDLFVGSQIVVVGKYKDGGTTDVILSGVINNEIQAFTFLNQNFSQNSLSKQSEVASLEFIPRLWATRKIGYLLNQIRLQGTEEELVEQVVQLSIRYGIVTPYTSFLVTEEAPLGAEAHERIVEGEMLSYDAAASEPSYGRSAVEKAAGQGALADADTVASPSANFAETVKIVGSRTFVFSDGVWIDTGYDPDRMPAMKVAFLSDDYFDLAESRHELADAFALGLRVIAISDGIAYEVVDLDSSLDPIEIPPAREEESPQGDINANQNEGEDLPDDPVPNLETESESPFYGTGLPCFGGLLPLFLFPLGLIAFKYHWE